MEDVVIRTLEKVALRDPVLIEGLPGVGNVGKLAADYLRDQLPAKPLATIHSKFFPPQVYVSEEGIIRLVSNDLSYWKATGSGQRDVLVLGGDYQGISPEGQYRDHRTRPPVLRDPRREGRLHARRVRARQGRRIAPRARRRDQRSARRGDEEVRRNLLPERPRRRTHRGERSLPRARSDVRDGGRLPHGRDERLLRRPPQRGGRSRRSSPRCSTSTSTSRRWKPKLRRSTGSRPRSTKPSSGARSPRGPARLPPGKTSGTSGRAAVRGRWTPARPPKPPRRTGSPACCTSRGPGPTPTDSFRSTGGWTWSSTPRGSGTTRALALRSAPREISTPPRTSTLCSPRRSRNGSRGSGTSWGTTDRSRSWRSGRATGLSPPGSSPPSARPSSPATTFGSSSSNGPRRCGSARSPEPDTPPNRSGFPCVPAEAVSAFGPFEGVVVANELLDAQPVRRVRWNGTEWRELGVRLTPSGIRADEGPAAETVPEPSLPSSPADGTVFEFSPTAEGLVRELADHLVAGVWLVVDYGMEQDELLRAHPEGTLATVRGHRSGSDPVVAPGESDLSTFVNWTRLRAVARAAGLEVLADRTQAEALGAWGFPRLFEETLAARKVLRGGGPAAPPRQEPALRVRTIPRARAGPARLADRSRPLRNVRVGRPARRARRPSPGSTVGRSRGEATGRPPCAGRSSPTPPRSVGRPGGRGRTRGPRCEPVPAEGSPDRTGEPEREGAERRVRRLRPPLRGPGRRSGSRGRAPPSGGARTRSPRSGRRLPVPRGGRSGARERRRCSSGTRT